MTLGSVRSRYSFAPANAPRPNLAARLLADLPARCVLPRLAAVELALGEAPVAASGPVDDCESRPAGVGRHKMPPAARMTFTRSISPDVRRGSATAVRTGRPDPRRRAWAACPILRPGKSICRRSITGYLATIAQRGLDLTYPLRHTVPIRACSRQACIGGTTGGGRGLADPEGSDELLEKTWARRVGCVDCRHMRCLSRAARRSQSPKLGDNRYYAFSAAKARVRGIEAASAEGIAEGFASDAVILDAKTGTVVASGRARIRDLYAAWLAGCPQPRIETVKREYEMRGGVVTDVERVQCGARALGERRVRMEVVNRLIVREEGDWL